MKQATSNRQVEATLPARARRPAHFLDAAFACEAATTSICYDDPRQTGYEVVTAVVDGETQRDSVLVTVLPNVVIDSVSGPNAGGSFTSQPAEATLRLRASAGGFASPPQVRWEFANDPSYGFALRVPASVTGDLAASAVVPAQDAARYAGLPHPAPLTRTAMRFVVTASAVGLHPTIVSAPRIVQQTELDALREEYIEYGIPLPNPAWTLQNYPTATAFNIQILNSGDYSWAVINPALPLKLDTIQHLVGAPLTISSGFRDPMHYRIHAHVAVHPLSIHQYGSAADISTFGSDSRWTRLRDRARPTGACIEPMALSTNSHLHVDYDRPRTTPCPPEWQR